MDPIPLPKGRQPITLEDAGNYNTKLLDALGDATTAPDGRAARHEHPKHVVTALARMAETREPVPGPG